MEARVARSIAHYSHLAERDRFDELVIEHVERVAAAVPADLRSIAFLHDVLERTDTPVEELRSRGLTSLELEVLELLTRAEGESYELHTLRIAWASGPAGVVARAIKLADLDDHICHPDLPDGAPPYGWARRHIAVATERQSPTTDPERQCA